MQHRVTDVLVVGGGTAGVAAALSAAQNGAKVVLVERDGALGGVATRAGIHLYYYGINAGLQRELDRRTDELGDGIGGDSQGIHPEAKRLTAIEMLSEAGVDLIFHSLAVEVEMDDERRNVLGVVFAQPDDTLRVTANITIDATGDGDVCALAGVPFTLGREWDGGMNNYSVVPRYLYNGRIAPLNVDGGWVDSSSAQDVSRAYLEGRQILLDFLDDRLARDVYIATSPHLGVREGRQITGEYVLQLDDLAFDRRFDDVVMKCMTHYDTHAYDFANESLAAQIWVCVMGLWKQRIGCDIPFRCFIPKGVNGLLIGCRALSQTHDSAAGFRMQRDIQQVGEVVGAAASLCCNRGCQPRELDITALQHRLIDQGVLTPEDLTRQSRPWVQPKLEGVTVPLSLENLSNEANIAALIDALASEEDEGKALWWLTKAGERAVGPLLARLQSAEGAYARTLAIALALLGRADGASHLLRSIESRESDTPPGIRAAPRWIASLIALKALRETRAVDCLLDRLPNERETDSILHILHYFMAVVELIDESGRKRLRDTLYAVLDWPERGAEYQVWGGVNRSMKWSIDLAITCLLTELGEVRGWSLLEAYSLDSRGYVRHAAKCVREMCERARREAQGRASG